MARSNDPHSFNRLAATWLCVLALGGCGGGGGASGESPLGSASETESGAGTGSTSDGGAGSGSTSGSGAGTGSTSDSGTGSTSDSGPGSTSGSGAGTGNVGPVANAGIDRSLQIGETALLDGSASSDVNGDALTYAWSVTARPSGSAAAVTDATQPVARFVPDLAGDYTLSLVVNDGTLASAHDTVRVTVVASGSNRAPTADGGIDQNVSIGTVVTLDGSASWDPDGNLVTYVWTLDSKPANSAAAIVGASSPRPSLTPDQVGTYTASLVVIDSLNETSVADQVVVTVNALNKNNAPVAVAGSDQNVLVGATVELDGSGSVDTDGDLLTYSWSITSKPAGSTAQLSYTDGADDPAPTFVADVAGVYVIGLVVGDGKANATPVSVKVTAAVGNVAPVANAGDDASTVVGTTVNLSGTLSSDANGSDALTYAWKIVSRPAGSAAAPVNPSNPTATLTPDVAGLYVIELVVSDGMLSSAPDSVVVTVGNPGVNLAPVAKAGPRQRGVAIGQTVALDGSKSYDPNGTAVMYTWKFKSKPKKSTAALQGGTTVAPTFVPDVRGNYVVQLVVSDGQLTSVASTVMIQVRR
ncbi:MAG: PKD domain-containing protein [Pseudomonadota bacterium]